MQKLYEKIFADYKRKIETGALKPGDKIPTELEIAELFNVSRITVTRAIKELEAMGMVYRIKRKGTFVKGNKRDKHQQIIIPIVLPFDRDIGFEILKGASEEAEKNNCLITFFNAEYKSKKERMLVEKLKNENTAGVIIYPYISEDNIDLYSQMLVDKFPFVLLDKMINGIDANCVVSNNCNGMYELVKNLIRMGHEKIAYYCGSIQSISSELERYQGYCKAMIEEGISLNPKYIIETKLNEQFSKIDYDKHKNKEMEVAEYSLNQLMKLQEPPTAIVCVNDFSAMYMIKAALKLKINVPKDLSITGFDNLSLATHNEVPITTVEQSFYNMGAEAVKLLLKIIDNKDTKEKVLLDTQYIQRESAGPPKLL